MVVWALRAFRPQDPEPGGFTYILTLLWKKYCRFRAPQASHAHNFRVGREDQTEFDREPNFLLGLG